MTSERILGTSSHRWIYSIAAALAAVISIYILKPNIASSSLVSRTIPPVQHAQCENANYTVRVLSYEPLIMHLENFFTQAERCHVLNVSAPLFARSTVSSGKVDHRRTSSTATLTRDDPAIKCIYDRVSEFQGYVPKSSIENLQVTKYTAGQQFRDHFDWRHPSTYDSGNPRRVDRVTTFFGILDASCQDCGTQFPSIGVNWSEEDERWCDIVDCGENERLTVKPVPGSALFWRNLDDRGVGDVRTLHSGMPVGEGWKVGLNIWTEVEVDD